MAVTSPDNIWTPDAGDDYALTTDLAAMADTVQDAITDLRSDIGYRTDLTDAQRLALTGGDLFEGLRVWTTDTRVLWTYTQSAWVRSLPGQPYMMAAGSGTTNSSGDATVTLPAGRFNVTPSIVITGTSARYSTIASKSSTSFSVILANSSGTGVAGTFDWHAIQMTPTTAAG